jgi:hypothetical protein
MALSTRTVTIRLEQQTAKAVTLVFRPNLTGADDEVLLQRSYKVTTGADGTASIALPVSSEGSITYNYEIPGEGKEINTGSFSIAAGSAISLDDLINLGASATPSLQDYIDDAIEQFVADELDDQTGGTFGGEETGPGESGGEFGE